MPSREYVVVADGELWAVVSSAYSRYAEFRGIQDKHFAETLCEKINALVDEILFNCQ